MVRVRVRVRRFLRERHIGGLGVSHRLRFRLQTRIRFRVKVAYESLQLGLS